MGEILFYSTLTFFSVFGIISFILFISDFIYESRYLKKKKVYSLFTVENEVCTIENTVKSMLFKLYKNDVGICDQKMIIVDTGSNDGTYTLLKKLEKHENSILVCKKDELCEKLKNL